MTIKNIIYRIVILIMAILFLLGGVSIVDVSSEKYVERQFICHTLNEVCIDPVTEESTLDIVIVSAKESERSETIQTEESTTYKSIENQVIPLSDYWKEFVEQISVDYVVPTSIIYGIMYVETNFDFDADNGICLGIMQINRCNADWLYDKGIDIYDYRGNIEAGAYIISNFYSKYQDWHKALVCYNCGEGGASGISSSSYSHRVMNYSNSIQ